MKPDSSDNIDKSAFRIAFLVAGYIRQTLTEAEHDELDEWVDENDHNMLMFEDLTDPKNLEANLEWMDQVKTEQSFRELTDSGAFKKPVRKQISLLWVAAATVILLIGIFLISRHSYTKKTYKPGLADADSARLEPGGNRATLRLSDGSVINLATSKDGLLKKESGSDITKTADGQLVYVADSSAAEEPGMNSLSTPVGGQFQVTLPDGTKVWLNASSTIQYPTRFSMGRRIVQLAGEAYFEVAKNDRQPFDIFLSRSANITVLGTHFNVMSYQNEEAKEITLLEGSVSVNSGDKTEKLVPGMQATISGGGLIKRAAVDTEEVTGWKKGLFVFHDSPIHSIMNQVARWYDAEVVYQGEIKDVFNATIPRSEPLSKLLHLLELNGFGHFNIKNKTIYVRP